MSENLETELKKTKKTLNKYKKQLKKYKNKLQKLNENISNNELLNKNVDDKNVDDSKESLIKLKQIIKNILTDPELINESNFINLYKKLKYIYKKNVKINNNK